MSYNHKGFEFTKNYECGLTFLEEGRLRDAVTTLLAEPPESSCFSIAQADAALALHRLNRFQEAERLAEKTLSYMEEHGCPTLPSWVQCARVYAEALVMQGRNAESIPAFEQVEETADRLIEMNPDSTPEIELQKAHAYGVWGIALASLWRIDDALDKFQKGRGIYRKYESRNRVGRAELLTNYAHTLKIFGKNTPAEFALLEALQVAREDGNNDQVFRIQMGLIQLGSSHVARDEAHLIMHAAAAEAENTQRFSTAYVRLCIHAQYAADVGDTAVGLDVVEKACKLEPHLDSNDPHPAKLRMFMYRLLEQYGASEEKLLDVLIEGANLWFARISGPLDEEDFWEMTQTMHGHFQLLADCLLKLNRPEESVAAFEAGRSLAHSVEVDGQFLERVIKKNPFASGGVSVDLLQAARSSISEDDVLVVLTVLPAKLIAYVIGKEDIEVVRVPIADREQLILDIGMIPARLQERVSVRAIPGEVRNLAEEIRRVLGNRIVRALMPYSYLHSVPWRIVLRDVGVDWKQLPCGVEFGLFLRSGPPQPCLPGTCVALGHGKAGHGTVDLLDEAREFAQSFGPDSEVVAGCTKADVTRALKSADTVLISCHGAFHSRERDGQLVLKLADGDHLAEELFSAAEVFPAEDMFPAEELSPDCKVNARLVLLSACESGVYQMTWGDFPVGAAPMLIRVGARFVIGARFQVGAIFAAQFFPNVAKLVAAGHPIGEAVAQASAALEMAGADLWRDLACLELLGGP